MSEQVFETEIINRFGWKICLVTKRDENGMPKSSFTARFEAVGIPRYAKNLFQVHTYLHTLEALEKHLRFYNAYPHSDLYWRLDKDYTTDFITVLDTAIKDGSALKAIIAHNRKTLHQPHLLPGYSPDGGAYNFKIIDEMENGIELTIKLYPSHTDNGTTAKLEGSIHLATDDHTACRDFKNATPLLRPDAIQNAVMGSIIDLLQKAYPDIEDRKSIVAEIVKYFESGRFGFWVLLGRLNITKPIRKATKC